MTPPDPTGSGEAALKERIATALESVRRRSVGLTTDVLDPADLEKQHSRLMSPLVWDLAHVGNYEEQWLLRGPAGEQAGAQALRPDIDYLYDAFEQPRAVRPQLPLLGPDEASGYIGTVRDRVLDALERSRLDTHSPLLRDGFVFGMVIQHEHQHDETMLATHQLRAGDAALPEPAAPPAAPHTEGRSREVRIPAGTFRMGADTDTWSLDNERPAHDVNLHAYWIDAAPVSNEQYLEFMEAGGYGDRRWWTPAGWKWVTGSGRSAPGSWFREGDRWMRRRFGRIEPVPPPEAVQHVCWYEADAYARWAGKRLPTEAEWEKAAGWDPWLGRLRPYPWGDERPHNGHANLGQRHLRPAAVGAYPRGVSAYGAGQLLGDVWEWTSSDFTGYPGFRAFPYPEYSEAFFGSGYKVLRGGSWATDPVACRTTFRNWDLPIRRQIFAGFRCARDAEPA